MRFAWVMAAMAVLWMQPAGAVTIELPQTPEAGTHWKISLTGLTEEDSILAGASIPAVTWFFWEKPGVLHPDQAFPLDCSIQSGYPSCGASYTFSSPRYPVKAIFGLNLSIVGNDILFDWTMFAQDICASIPAAEITGSNSDICGYRWGDVPGLLSFGVEGPSSRTFGYTITDITRSPVPEPAIWAMLVLGIGLIGIGLRRRHHAVAPSFQIGADAVDPGFNAPGPVVSARLSPPAPASAFFGTNSGKPAFHAACQV